MEDGDPLVLALNDGGSACSFSFKGNGIESS